MDGFAGDQFLKADRAIIGVECCLQGLMKVSRIIRSGPYWLHSSKVSQCLHADLSWQATGDAVRWHTGLSPHGSWAA